MGVPVYVFVPKFYTDVVGVEIGTAGLILGAVRVFDAVLDPAVGILSDRTRTRFGRRRPWIALGAWPLAAAMFFLLVPQVSGAAAGAWFGVTIFALFFFWTCVTVPYESLGMELSEDYDERTSLLGLRDGLVIVGTLAASASPFVLTKLLALPEDASGERSRLLGMALVYAPLLVGLCALCAGAVRERPLPTRAERSEVGSSRPEASGLAALRSLARNRPFVIMTNAYWVAAIGSNLPGLLMSYYVDSYLHSTKTPRYLLVYFVTGIVLLPAWIALARRIGKRATWLTAMAVNSGAFFFVFFLRRDQEWLYEILVMLSGTAFGATLAIPSSMQADVVDYDELLSGERREGLLLGVWCVLRKLAAALPVGVALPLLGLAGYDAKRPDQTDDVFLTLRLLYAVLPSVCSFVAVAIAWRYPIDKERHAAIKEAIRARREGRTLPDPLAPPAPASLAAAGPA